MGYCAIGVEGVGDITTSGLDVAAGAAGAGASVFCVFDALCLSLPGTSRLRLSPQPPSIAHTTAEKMIARSIIDISFWLP